MVGRNAACLMSQEAAPEFDVHRPGRVRDVRRNPSFFRHPGSQPHSGFTEVWRRSSRTDVNPAPRARACEAWVWRIQCGLARRSFSAVVGLSASTTWATFMKKRRITHPQMRGRDAGCVFLIEVAAG